MKNTENDLIFELLMWNAPKLLASLDPGARSFAHLLYLVPSELNKADTPDAASSASERSALEIAADGLRLELRNKPDEAAHEYAQLLEVPGPAALLGSLLIAWMEKSGIQDFRRTESILISNEIAPKYAARAYAKLALWAMERGFKDDSHYYYGLALATARGDFKELLLREGRWYGAGLRFSRRALRGDLILYPWIEEFVLQSTQNFLKESVANLTRPSRGYTWRLGGSGGHEIRSAVLQASWCGMTGLYREIQRTEASLILNRSDEDRGQIPEALSLWIKSSGERVESLIEKFEADFDDNTAAELLTDLLHNGSSVPSERAWLETCSALWDQMPAPLVKKAIDEAEISPTRSLLPPNSAASTESLFAILSLRDPQSWQNKFLALSVEAKDIVIRSMGPGVAKWLPEHVLRPAAEASLDSSIIERRDKSWNDIGWATIAAILMRIEDEELNRRFVDLAPPLALPGLAEEYPKLVAKEKIEKHLASVIYTLKEDLKNQSKGTYAEYSYPPGITSATCIAYLKTADSEISGLLVQMATSPESSSSQAIDALRGLRKLAQIGLVHRDDIETILSEDRPAVDRFALWEGTASKRLEDAERAILRAQFQQSAVAEVAGACRDPEVSVRKTAVRAIVNMAESKKTTLLDVTLLGTLYDPNHDIQAIGVRAFLDKDAVMDEDVKSLGIARILKIWGTAHRRVRASIAIGARTLASRDEAPIELIQLIEQDRSAMVRTAGMKI